MIPERMKEIFTLLHSMIDVLEENMSADIVIGAAPLIRISLPADEDGEVLRLVVGMEYENDE